MNEEQKLIDHWSESLTDRLLEVRYVDVDVMKKAIKTHFKAALFDLLKVQLSETHEQLSAAKEQYALSQGTNNYHIQAELVKLKRKLKQQNKLYSTLEHNKRLKELTIWMRQHHEASLESFYEYFATLCYRKPD
jgi:hypothetical protein